MIYNFATNVIPPSGEWYFTYYGRKWYQILLWRLIVWQIKIYHKITPQCKSKTVVGRGEKMMKCPWHARELQHIIKNLYQCPDCGQVYSWDKEMNSLTTEAIDKDSKLDVEE